MARAIRILANGSGFAEGAFGGAEKAGLLAELTVGASAFTVGDHPALLDGGVDAVVGLLGPTEIGWLCCGFGSLIIQIGILNGFNLNCYCFSSVSATPQAW